MDSEKKNLSKPYMDLNNLAKNEMHKFDIKMQ